ncbi:tetratricopeptide repeat protein, partial [Bacteriovoracaceae bacterium]|nr:tetratricopeptide repeat protein [Bacteriovoracaceae bacterium]
MQNADLIFNKAKDAYEQSDLVNSSKLFEEYININPNNAEAYFFMGNIFHMKGQIGKAIKGFKKVLEIEPHHTEASISLSVLLNDIGRYDEAKKIFERANSNLSISKEGVNDPQINRRFSLKHYELAEMYFSYGRYEESLFEYNKASSLDTDNLEIRIKIAKVYAKKGYNSK